MLEVLKDPESREVLAWVGGGLCVVVSALWTAYLKLGAKPDAAPPAPPAPPATTASADRGGIAGDVTITTNRIPVGVWLLGAAGLALLALALLSAGERLNCAAKVGGSMENSTIEIDASEC